MSIRETLIDCSKGDNLRLYWRLFRWRGHTRRRPVRAVLTFFLNRMAHHHGGYIGNGAVFGGIPVLPHGLHGVYISRYARIGADCWIYQNVTLGAESPADRRPLLDRRGGCDRGQYQARQSCQDRRRRGGVFGCSRLCHCGSSAGPPDLSGVRTCRNSAKAGPGSNLTGRPCATMYLSCAHGSPAGVNSCPPSKPTPTATAPP